MQNADDLDRVRSHGTQQNPRERLLDLLLSADRKRRLNNLRIGRRPNGHDPIPLSYAQERLWFLDHVGLVGSAYTMSLAVSLRGHVVQNALERALLELVRRHESLRTRFIVRGGAPVQLIEPRSHFVLERADFSQLADEERRILQLRNRMQAEQQHRFNLREGPLFRAVLVRLASQDYALLLTMHHIVSDGWSLAVILNELSTLYTAYVRGQRSPLPELPIQYADYAVWQRQWLSGEVLNEQLRYWRRRLLGAPPQLQLPTDYPRPPIESFKGETLRFELPPDLHGALNELARVHGATLFMVSLAAYQVLLWRWSGEQDIVVGSPIAGRRHGELEGLIGFFVNTLVLRTKLSGDLSFRQLLEIVKEGSLGAYAHQDLPFEMLVKELRPDRNLLRQPLFQVALALQNYPQHRFDLPDLTWTRLEGESLTTHFDLMLYLYEGAAGLSEVFEYATDLFDKQTVSRLAGNYRTLLESIVADPDSPIRTLPLLTEMDKRQLLLEWNTRFVPEQAAVCVHDLFARQVERTPDAIAALHEAQSLTYAELNRRANQLAHYLREKGVGPESLVAICVERGLEMLVGLLGVLKAGSAYVPMDPQYPFERLAYMLEDASPTVLLTQERLKDKVQNQAGEVVALDADWRHIDRRPSEDCHSSTLGLSPQNLAYVIYTSGSTGRPKGVMVEHRNLTRLFAITEQWFSFTERDVWTLFHSFAFDFSVWELWGALLYGGRVVLVPQLTARSPEDFYQLLCAEGVTILNQTPSAFAQLISAQAESEEHHSLRLVIFGGEALDLRTLRPWVKRNGGERPQLVNMYGITETTVHVTYRPLTNQEIESQRGSLIGNPIPDLKAYLLDQECQLVPISVTGEMYVSGAGVARGYLNRAGLTAERFIADPFSSDPRARLYKTGDLARWRSDGSLEYLGRNDHQVKIRGYRIELGEIEAQIASHEKVADVVVVARDDEPGEKRLVAYVVSNRSAVREEASNEVPQKLRSEVVSGWETVFKQTYETGQTVPGPSFVGWNSSYTGQPIPEAQMQEWLDRTIERILALEPRRVLEIGCGVGLVLQQLAPHCDKYVGTDLSSAALDQLRAWMCGRDGLRHVELLHRSGDELQDLPSGSFDTIVLNSVVQYFPDIDYLVTVLQEGMRLLSSGGKIFVGDVRHLGTLPVLHSAIQLGKAAATVSIEQLKKRVARALAQEKELAIDPEFFHVLPRQLPEISHVEVQLKRGCAPNELTRYRYDVVLHVGESMRAGGESERIEWSTAIWSVAELETALKERRWAAVRFASIPNARLTRDVKAQRLIETGDDHLEASSVRGQLNSTSYDGVEPETFWELGARYGFHVQVGWDPRSPGCFQVQLLDRAKADQVPRAVTVPDVIKPWSAYATDPLEYSFRQQLIAQLREHLKERLPEYMVPSSFMLLKEFPLTPNGKLDRRALPAPQNRPEEMGEYIAPRTNIERALADVWAQLLNVDQVGVQDNFFELGGHSLLIVQMIDRLRQIGLRVELRSVYASPTLADLARTLTHQAADAFLIPPRLIPQNCDVITPEMLPLVQLEPEQIERVVREVPGGVGNIEDIYPLAPLQEGILFHHLTGKQGDAYARSILFCVSSRERVDRLAQALQEVVNRHEILRSAVLWEHLPRPVQVVYRRAPLPVEVLPLNPRVSPVQQLTPRMRAQQQPLDLRKAPLIRLEIASDQEGSQWYVLLHTHHLVFDNQSLSTMLSEVLAHIEGRAHSLPTPVPYRNYVAQTVAYAETHDAEAFFRAKLADVRESTALFGISDVHGDGGGAHEASKRLEPNLSKRLRTQARRRAMSAATLFHAAWALVVSQTSGRDDIVFGTVLLGRLQADTALQQTLGMFINTLPLRLALHSVSAEELVDCAQSELVELMKREQTSLAVAQRCSGVSGTAPLFNSLLNYLHDSTASNTECSLKTSGVTVVATRGGTNYPIAVSVLEEGDAFALQVETDRNIDPGRIVEYTLTAIQSLVRALEQYPEIPALRLPVLPEDEWHRVVHEFNATRVPYPHDRMIHELFEQQVLRTPDAIAALCDGEALTYAELNRKANQLAHYLRGRGARIGEYIPLLMSRSLHLVVAQLAVLKSGGVYIPIDPKMPTERQAFVVHDCGARFVVAEQGKGPESAQDGLTWINYREIGEACRSSPSHDLKLRISGLSPAYVMYTSGSTGVPKGVVVPHRAVNRLVINNYVHFESTDRVAHSSNPMFDAATFEIWGPMLNGASLLVVPQSVVLDPARLSELLRREQVTILWLTVGLLAQYAAALTDVFGALRYLLTGGDIVEPEIVKRVLGTRPPKHVLNAYGPTECTTFSTTYLIEADQREGAIPIGHPISNTQVYVLDKTLRPVPIGVTGEIYIGGDGLALGYLNRPELMAERFIANPFSTTAEGRLYKSGDVGRWRADGALEFLGRNDHQVKIRGFRVELGEIEAQLARYCKVKDAVVLARADSIAGKRLVAYVTPRGDIHPMAAELRAQLEGALPDYMVPSAFVVLDKLPLTANGKVDRRALPEPEAGAFALQQYEAPLGDLEETMAQIWKELLNVDRVGRQDSFFELGGHSLLAIKAVSRANQSFGSALTVLDIYRSPTISDLAARIGGGEINDEVVDLSTQAFLDHTIVANLGRPRTPPQAVLLTGSTGFVGRFLLAQLLRDTSATVFCLVRADTDRDALVRVKVCLSKWGLWLNEFEGRVVGIAGDLGKPHLGMDEVTCQALCENIDSIYHCAASMNHLETYDMARAVNVEATRRLLELATKGQPKCLNYISTLSVFNSRQTKTTRIVDESSTIDYENHSRSRGYVASKWVGEKIIMTARARGIPCNIFRLGLVWADVEQGRYDELQREYRIFKSCLLSGFAMMNYQYPLAPTPVDYVARAVVFLGTRHAAQSGIFHISSSRQSIQKGVFERCNEVAGTTLRLVSPYEWMCEIKRIHHQGRSLPAVPLFEYTFSMNREEFLTEQTEDRIDRIRIECTQTQRELESAGIAAPLFNDELLKVFVDKLRLETFAHESVVTNENRQVVVADGIRFKNSGASVSARP